MPIVMAPVQGILFKLEDLEDGQVRVSWMFHQKEHSVTGKDLPEAMENAVVAATALVQQGGLL
jgi:uncharacterized protein YidB (DUF937 family)